MDSDSDGRLNQFEMRRAGPEIFMLLDSDGNDYVTRDELQHMMKVLQAKHNTLVGDDINHEQ